MGASAVSLTSPRPPSPPIRSCEYWESGDCSWASSVRLPLAALPPCPCCFPVVRMVGSTLIKTEVLDLVSGPLRSGAVERSSFEQHKASLCTWALFLNSLSKSEAEKSKGPHYFGNTKLQENKMRKLKADILTFCKNLFDKLLK